MNASAPASFVLLLVGAVVALAGVVIMLRGRRGVRRGDTPHCRRCDYPLVGLASDRCPECGTPLTPEHVVRGGRVRRPGLVAGGAGLGVVGLAMLIGGGTAAVDRIDWYRLKPTAWLISDVESGPPSTAGQAWAELRRRSDGGGLSGGHRTRLAELALTRQAKDPPGSLLREMVDWLGTAAAAGELTPEQKERFFRQIVQLQLRVRQKVAAGDPVPYRIGHGGRGPSSLGWWTRVGPVEVTVEGRRVAGPGGHSGFSGMGGGGSSGSALPPVEAPGRKTVAATVRVQVYGGPRQFDEENPATELLHEHDVLLTDALEVLAVPPAELVRPVRQPDPAAVRASLRPRNFRRSTSPDQLSGMVDVTNAPADLAFDVFIRVGGKEYPLGGVTWRKGVNGGWGLSGRLPEGPVPEIDLVFRGSSERARGTVDLYEFWEGEIVFDDVPVENGGGGARPARRSDRLGDANP